MAELFEAVASLSTLLMVLLVFGFAPGFVLRLLVLAYPRSDPRRRELISELYAVPRIQRPLWVAEQLEVALFEGLAHRASATIRLITRQRRARTQTDKREVRARLMTRVSMVGAVGRIVSGIVLLVLAVVGNVGGIVSEAEAVAWVAVVVAVVVTVAEGVALRTVRRRLNTRARRRFRP